MLPFQFSSSVSSGTSSLTGPAGSAGSATFPPMVPDSSALQRWGSQSAPMSIGSTQINFNLQPSPPVLNTVLLGLSFGSSQGSDLVMPGSASAQLSSSSSSTPLHKSAPEPPSLSARRLSLPHSREQSDALPYPDPKRIRLTQPGGDAMLDTASRSNSVSEIRQLVHQLAKISAKASLTKTAQQQRDNMVRESLDPLLPPVLVNLTRDYIEPEQSLAPLALNEFGEAVDNQTNAAILQAIYLIFASDCPNAAAFQDDIIKTHTRYVLDRQFLQLFETDAHVTTLDQILSGDQQALRRRKSQLMAVANYLPFSKSEQMVKDELHGIKIVLPHKMDQGSNREISRLDTNLKLFLDCLHNTNPVVESRTRSRVLYKYNVDRMRLIIESAIEKRYYIHARGLLKMFAQCCQANDKRGAIVIAIQLFDISGLKNEGDLREIIQFFEFIQMLCRTYPADPDLLAKLLFKMDDLAQKRGEYQLVRSLYQKAIFQQTINLPPRYQAKISFRYFMLGLGSAAKPRSFDMFKATVNMIVQLDRIHRAHHIRDPFSFRLVPPREGGRASDNQVKFEDVSAGEFLRDFAKSYQLAGQFAYAHMDSCTTMSVEQRAVFDQLFHISRTLEQGGLNYSVCKAYLPLKHSGARFSPEQSAETARRTWIDAVADCYKNALKILFVKISEEYDRERYYKNYPPAIENRGKLHWELGMAVLEDLVQLYLTHGCATELQALLHIKNRAPYRSFPGLIKRVNAWRKSLQSDCDQMQLSTKAPKRSKK